MKAVEYLKYLDETVDELNANGLGQKADDLLGLAVKEITFGLLGELTELFQKRGKSVSSVLSSRDEINAKWNAVAKRAKAKSGCELLKRDGFKNFINQRLKADGLLDFDTLRRVSALERRLS